MHKKYMHSNSPSTHPKTCAPSAYLELHRAVEQIQDIDFH